MGAYSAGRSGACGNVDLPGVPCPQTKAVPSSTDMGRQVSKPVWEPGPTHCFSVQPVSLRMAFTLFTFLNVSRRSKEHFMLHEDARIQISASGTEASDMQPDSLPPIHSVSTTVPQSTAVTGETAHTPYNVFSVTLSRKSLSTSIWVKNSSVVAQAKGWSMTRREFEGRPYNR